MRKGYRVTLGILTIMILLTISVGTSYSFYSVSATQDGTNNLTSSCFSVEFKDTVDNNTYKGSIKLNAEGHYAYPMTEENAKTKLTPYTFTLTNNCTTENATTGINYSIIINTMTQTPSDTTKGDLTEYLKYKIGEETSQKLNTTPYTTPSYVTNEKAGDIAHTYLLKSGTLAQNGSETFNLRIWIPDDACNGNECEEKIMGKTFEGQIMVITSMGTVASTLP